MIEKLFGLRGGPIMDSEDSQGGSATGGESSGGSGGETSETKGEATKNEGGNAQGEDKGGDGKGDGKSNASGGGETSGGSGSDDDFVKDLEGKTPEELREIAKNLRADRAKKNKKLERLTDADKRNRELEDRIKALERERMTDSERAEADAKEKAEREASLVQENRELKIRSAINSTGSKVKEREFVEFKMGQFLDANPKATPEELEEEAGRIREANPTAFEIAEGNGSVRTAGGASTGNSSASDKQARLKILREKYSNRVGLSVEEQAAIVGEMTRLETELGLH